MVASVVFSILLVSGVAVFVSSQARARLYSSSNAGDYLGDTFQVLEAAEGTNFLLYLQDELGSGALGCGSALPFVSDSIGSLSESQTEGNLTVSASARLVAVGDLADNLTALRPFNGSVSGDLDLAIRFDGTGADGPDVTFSRGEVHYVHIGARLYEEVSDCLGAVADIEGALSKSTASNCTSEGIDTLMQEAEALPASLSSRDGFSFGVSYSLSDVGACEVSFQVSLAQPGVAGPAGQFVVRLGQGGSVQIMTPSS